jgi:hypothetical protein
MLAAFGIPAHRVEDRIGMESPDRVTVDVFRSPAPIDSRLTGAEIS